MHASRSAVLGVVLFAGIALLPISANGAQGGHRLRGTITSVSSNAIVVTGRDGKPVTVKTGSATRIVGRVSGRFEDIKAGDVVKVIADKAQDGSFVALAVQDVPSGLQIPVPGRGGQRQLKSGKMFMSGSVVSVRGNSLSIASGDATVMAVTVPQTARIQRMTLLAASSFAPGVRVAVEGTDNPDGTITASLIMLERKAP